MFSSAKRRRVYMDMVAQGAADYRVKLLAWSAAGKTASFVVIPPDADSLSSFMRVTHTRFTRYLHANGVDGQIITQRFASCALDNPTALEAIKFVERQPVDLGVVRDPGDYDACSAAVRLGKTELAAEALSESVAITGKVRDWGKFLRQPLDRQRAEYLAMRMRTGKPAGDPAFVRRIENKLGLNLSRGRGRPRSK